jgi:hypothetical protein
MGSFVHPKEAQQNAIVVRASVFNSVEWAGPLALYFRAQAPSPTEPEESPWIAGSFS